MGGRGSDLFENETLRDIGDKYGKSPAQVMIRWHMQREVIPLPKSVHETRIVQNIHVDVYKRQTMHSSSAANTVRSPRHSDVRH